MIVIVIVIMPVPCPWSPCPAAVSPVWLQQEPPASGLDAGLLGPGTPPPKRLTVTPDAKAAVNGQWPDHRHQRVHQSPGGAVGPRPFGVAIKKEVVAARSGA